ncbi:MAG: hypothetical protein HC921_01980 [Synechococcaceae cyanobacterium SM2_3_1]|nr:hypothetical protein [Synechococcaceae cyanobacterium SM2_3_1]
MIPLPLAYGISMALIGLLFWEIGTLVRSFLKVAQRMHQIPCHDCRYCASQSPLKCAVHPQWALTEKAIGCQDFDPLITS